MNDKRLNSHHLYWSVCAGEIGLVLFLVKKFINYEHFSLMLG